MLRDGQRFAAGRQEQAQKWPVEHQDGHDRHARRDQRKQQTLARDQIDSFVGIATYA